MAYFSHLALNCTGYHALDNVLLTGQIEDDNRDYGQYQQCHHGTQILCTVRTYQVLYYNRYGLVISTQADHQIRQQIVVPDPHGIQNGYGDGCGLQDRHYDTEEGLQRVASVDHGCPVESI